MILLNFEDIIKPINNIWSNLNYRNTSAKNKYNLIVRNKKLIHDFDSDIDNLILHCINYYDNINLFVIFGKNKKESYQYYLDHFKDDYILFGLKNIQLNGNMIPKIMYQLLFSRMIIKTKDNLCSALKDIHYLNNNINNINIEITILIVRKRDLKKKYPNSDILNKHFYIYIPNTKESIWNCASVFFSETTLSFLEKQKLEYFLSENMKQSKKMFLKYRDWFRSNIDLENQSQFMLYSSVVLYLLGSRNINDIDLYIHNVPEDIIKKSNELKDEKYFNFKIDFRIKNTDNWPRYWDTWLDTWAQKCGAKYFEEILGNPKYHFYFLGMKIISLDCDIIRRIERNRPRGIADLIVLQKRYGCKINIPSIPDKVKKYESTFEKTEEELNKLILKGGVLNEIQKEICIEYNCNKSKFMGTIIYILKERYNMTFIEEEVNKELNRHNNNFMTCDRDSSSKNIKLLINKVKT